MEQKDLLYQQLKLKIDPQEYNASNWILVVRHVMEFLEKFPSFKEQRKELAILLSQMVLTDPDINPLAKEHPEIAQELSDLVVVSGPVIIETIVEATRGKLLINNTVKSVKGCFSCLKK